MIIDKEIAFAAVLVLATYALKDLFDMFFETWYCRKAQYDCEFCGYWACPAHYCNRKRAAIEERNTKNLQNDVAGDVDCNT